jgi:hypothetical protein
MRRNSIHTFHISYYDALCQNDTSREKENAPSITNPTDRRHHCRIINIRCYGHDQYYLSIYGTNTYHQVRDWTSVLLDSPSMLLLDTMTMTGRGKEDCVWCRNCGSKTTGFLTPNPVKEKTAHWLKGGERVKLMTI